MGGAIAADYLERAGSSAPFRKAVLSSPMLEIAYPDGKTEDSVIRETWLACHTPFGPKCDDFVPGRGPDAPAPVFAGNPYTHSVARFEAKLATYARWPESQTIGPTVQWVSESAKADKAMREPQAAAKIAVPLLILQAGKDSIVDNKGQAA
jgi:lysophospholipase